MKNLLLIFTMALATSACAAEFNPDLSSMEETGTGTEGGGDDTGGADTGSTGTPDMGGGTGDTGSTDDTGETGNDPVCGNGILEEGEDCDGLDFGEETCESQGFPNGGDLYCDADCVRWTGSCYANTCDDQPVEGNYSPCETNQQGGETCGDADLYCVTDNPPAGVCAKQCQNPMECQDQAVAGCGEQVCLIPDGESQGRCYISCTNNNECPGSMSCTAFGLLNNATICM